MVDRLRALLDHPLDPHVARAVLVLSSAILLGLAALFILAASRPDGVGERGAEAPVSDSRPRGQAIDASDDLGGRPAGVGKRARQDPQDVPGSPAARRAARALRTHRALQHVPYRDSRVAIDLVGARGHRAVLRVSAGSARAARRGWRRFLRRYDDAGRAYLPVFAAKGGGNG